MSRTGRLWSAESPEQEGGDAIAATTEHASAAHHVALRAVRELQRIGDPIDQVEQEDDVYGFRQRRLADTCISSRFDVGWTRFIGVLVSLTTKCAAAVTVGPAAPFRQSGKAGDGNARSAIDECVPMQKEHELASETTAASNSRSPTVQLDGPRNVS